MNALRLESSVYLSFLDQCALLNDVLSVLEMTISPATQPAGKSEEDMPFSMIHISLS